MVCRKAGLNPMCHGCDHGSADAGYSDACSGLYGCRMGTPKKACCPVHQAYLRCADTTLSSETCDHSFSRMFCRSLGMQIGFVASSPLRLISLPSQELAECLGKVSSRLPLFAWLRHRDRQLACHAQGAQYAVERDDRCCVSDSRLDRSQQDLFRTQTEDLRSDYLHISNRRSWASNTTVAMGMIVTSRPYG